jgi:hypothetical protein
MRSLLLLFFLVAAVLAQRSLPAVDSIDVYGLRRVRENAVRRAVAIAPSDGVPDSASKAATLGRLCAITGVEDAAPFAVCCEGNGRTMLFVGIAEAGAPRPSFRSAPSGNVRLPMEIVARDRIFALLGRRLRLLSIRRV